MCMYIVSTLYMLHALHQCALVPGDAFLGKTMETLTLTQNNHGKYPCWCLAQEEQKKEVSEEWHRKAQQMADEAYAHRLNELKMSGHDEQEQLDGDFTGLGSIGISNWYIMG